MAAQLLMAYPGEVALTTAAKTVVQIIAPANIRLRVKGWSVSFDGTSTTAAPVLVRLLRQSTAGTVTSLTLTKMGMAGSETIQSTAGHTATAEPTAGDVLDAVNVHPQGGFEKVFLPGDEIIIPGGGRLGIECTAGAAVNVLPKIWFEE